MKTIGVLTGGGDCPGLNAAIRAAVRAGIRNDFETLGIRDGWQEVMTMPHGHPGPAAG